MSEPGAGLGDDSPNEQRVAVQVAYALPTVQHRIDLTLPSGSTVSEAVAASGILQRCPELMGQDLVLGIWGERVAPDTAVTGGDRVEIYRPLAEDPRARRRRAVAERRARPDRE